MFITNMQYIQYMQYMRIYTMFYKSVLEFAEMIPFFIINFFCKYAFALFVYITMHPN